ncbi:hypothetical protein RAG15_26670 [Klebsiella pneumoniae]
MAKGKSALAMALKKKIGSNDEIQKVSHWIDSGFPPLNKAISGRYDGGFPSGRIVEIFGPPSAGKTFLATAAMVSAQKQEGLAVFLDHENSFDVGLAVANGLNADEDDGQWVYKQPDTFEESVELIGTILKLVRDEELIPADAPICIVADSLASMVPNSKAEKFDKMAEGTAKDKDQLNMNDNTALARATSANFPTLALWARKYNACIIFLNQVRTKIGVIGQDVGAECIKNKVAPPFGKCSWKFYFDPTRGLDVIESLVEHMLEEGYLPKNASGRVEIGDKKYTKSQIVDMYREKPLTEIIAALQAIEDRRMKESKTLVEGD